MTIPTMTTDTEAPHPGGDGAAAAAARNVAEADFLRQARPCCDCLSRGRCPVSRLLVDDAAGPASAVVSCSYTLAHGDHLFRQSDKVQALYVVKSGSAKVYFTSESGGEQVVAFYMPGDMVGLDALGVAQHASSALALESTAVCVIPFGSLEKACRNSAGSGWHHCLYKLLSRELMRDHRTLELINMKDAEAKMASFLLNLSARFKERGYSASSFNLSMKRSEIGSYLGLAVETVSRILTRFQEDGLLRVQRRRVEIFDQGALEELAG